MRVLLDTQAFLWFVLGDSRLSANAKSAILDPSNEKAVSPASCWEIAIKASLGKDKLQETYQAFMRRSIEGNGFTILPIGTEHTAAVASLPFHHRDLFDRLLVAQSLVEQISLVSSDALLDAYGINRLW